MKEYRVFWDDKKEPDFKPAGNCVVEASDKQDAISKAKIITGNNGEQYYNWKAEELTVVRQFSDQYWVAQNGSPAEFLILKGQVGKKVELLRQRKRKARRRR